ncbi:uncharacterized protein LOC115886186 [Sitophilus oryzae]|uniref:Uncharacterized protein LOC115886186 n=1 Tax=Sitophilus oryzae TaxID=7048 RepID=A0A6J2YE25_SITOR|nr:uncharacterized protein LOC115886186 [Sitophilus oryzae]
MKMTSEEILKCFNRKRIFLKRSISATGIDMPNITTLNLRDTKSVTCNMETPQMKLNKSKKEEDDFDFHDAIKTRDIYSGDTILVNREALMYQGKKYNINDIASAWKKDCRMWLWKNTWEFKMHKSVGEKIR